jgi:hypothetical protein
MMLYVRKENKQHHFASQKAMNEMQPSASPLRRYCLPTKMDIEFFILDVRYLLVATHCVRHNVGLDELPDLGRQNWWGSSAID